MDGFGFEERLVVSSNDPRAIEHAELRWPEGGGVMLGSANRDGDEFARRPAGTAAVYVMTDAVDAVIEPRDGGRRRRGPCPGRSDYGGRTATVRDHEGNLWTFGSYRGA